MSQIYVLKCESGKYYVGKTDDLKKRLKSHLKGDGSAWTSLYKPIKIVELRPVTSSHDENNVTKDMMKKHGIENVRGGAYTQTELPDEVIDILRQELYSVDDCCYKCGEPGHFAKDCEELEEEYVVWCCSSCNREFDNEWAAEKHEQRCGGQLAYEDSKKGACFRCGRSGHYVSECYASRHAKGYSLD